MMENIYEVQEKSIHVMAEKTKQYLSRRDHKFQPPFLEVSTSINQNNNKKKI